MITKIQEEMQNELANKDLFSENGARMHASTGKALLDMNFKIPQYRGATEDEIIKDFLKTYSQEPELTLKWLFFVRDIREGLGERRLFRILFPQVLLAVKDSKNLIKYISDYGRWDDVFCCFGIMDYIDEEIYILIRQQLSEDITRMKENKSISLLGKWLPSINTSSKATRNLARKIAEKIPMTERNYRKCLSKLRQYIDVIEVKTSAKKWNEIDYEKVPSQANLKYKNAFLRNDEERRRNYLSRLEKGEVKINSSVLFPHDIVHQYMEQQSWNSRVKKVDQALEGLWNNLPNYGISDTLVVADGSGSMTCSIPGTKAMALDVANALAIYCSERNQGEFKNKYITFSESPQLVDFSGVKTLNAKLKIALSHNEVANTNIYAVFKLVLNTAVKNKMKQDEMVKNILIISDMEFDYASNNANEKLFEQIAREYNEAGYQLPRCIFWNVNSRTGVIPMTTNEAGVALVSGFSVHIAQMVMENELDPFKVLVKKLMSERYKNITLS